MTHDRHAPRRTPTTPTGPLNLSEAATELLAQARRLAAQRSARTLTPGADTSVKQTLLALVAGQRLDDHPAPGPTTLHAITGRILVHHGNETFELSQGQWSVCPAGQHSIEAHSDAVVLLTVAHRPPDRSDVPTSPGD